MLYRDNVYILTNLFYTIPTYTDYLQVKNDTLVALLPDYLKKSVQEKWALLMTEFENALQAHDLTKGSLTAFKEELSAFKKKREETSASYYNLSLTQCVNYFEEFLFLYTTKDSRFTLKPAEKKNLLNAIREALDTCETGINGRFYTALQDHRKDNDWIKTELSKARCEALHLLHQSYGGADVHTYNKLVELANEKHLGIATKEEIWDVHANMVDVRALKSFFTHQYPIFFERYEKQAIDNLTNYYLNELTSILQLSSVDWTQGPVTISSDRTTDLQKSIESHFDGINITGVVDSLGETSEDYLQFTLKPKKDVEPLIKSLVTDKLLADRYCVSLNELKTSADQSLNLRLKKGVSLERLIQVNESLQQNNNHLIHEVLSQNSQLLIHYPELILSRVKSHPDILLYIPHWLKTDTRFIEAAMTILDDLLCKAIEENDNEKIDSITTQILHVIELEHSYLQTLSLPILKNVRVAQKLLDSNVLYFGYLHLSLQNNPELYSQVIAANPFRDIPIGYTPKSWLNGIQSAHSRIQWDLPQEYKKEPSLVCPVKPVSYHHTLTHFLRIKAFDTLIKKNPLTANDFLNAVIHLNPDLLLKIIEHRKIHGLSPLPFFEKEDTITALKQFNQEVKTRFKLDWSQDYSAIRRQACEQENFAFLDRWFYNKNAMTFLSKTNNWFAAFKQYQHDLTSKEKIFAQLIAVLKAYYSLIVSILKISVIYFTLNYAIPLISKIIEPFFWYGVVTSIALARINNWYLSSRQLSTANDLFWRILFLDYELFFTLIWRLILIGLNFYNQLSLIITSSISLLTTLFKATGSCFQPSEYLADSLEDTCHKALVRLDNIDTPSAHEKSALLRNLLSQAKADVDKQECTLQESLEHKYTIVHHNQEYQLSFSEVAATRRKHQESFNLNEKPDYLRFFKTVPTTEALIKTVTMTPAI